LTIQIAANDRLALFLVQFHHSPEPAGTSSINPTSRALKSNPAKATASWSSCASRRR